MEKLKKLLDLRPSYINQSDTEVKLVFFSGAFFRAFPLKDCYDTPVVVVGDWDTLMNTYILQASKYSSEDLLSSFCSFTSIKGTVTVQWKDCELEHLQTDFERGILMKYT